MELFDRAAVAFQLVLTKIDDVKTEKVARKMAEVQAVVKAHAAAYPEVIATSSRTGAGIEVLRASLATLAEARAAGDGAAYVREAHAIKGGCGMVGATELHSLADGMEASGIAPDGISSPGMDPLDGFLAATARLRRILDAQD